MTRIENHCCDCAAPGYPCIGWLCELRRVEVHYCDRCGSEAEEIYTVDGKELCEDCALKLNICPYCHEPTYDGEKCSFCGRGYDEEDEKTED